MQYENRAFGKKSREFPNVKSCGSRLLTGMVTITLRERGFTERQSKENERERTRKKGAHTRFRLNETTCFKVSGGHAIRCLPRQRRGRFCEEQTNMHTYFHFFESWRWFGWVLLFAWSALGSTIHFCRNGNNCHYVGARERKRTQPTISNSTYT